MYNTETTIKNIVLYTSSLLKVGPKCSPHKKKKYGNSVVIILQQQCISDYQVVHFKYTIFNF